MSRGSGFSIYIAMNEEEKLGLRFFTLLSSPAYSINFLSNKVYYFYFLLLVFDFEEVVIV